MSDDRKDIPNASAPNWQQRVTEAMRVYMGKTGNRLDRGVTMRDLVDAGIAQFRGGAGGYLGLKPGTGILEGGTEGGGGGGGGDPVPYEPDLTPPPTPTGFTVAAAISNLFVEHDDPLYPQGHGHARTVVYGAIYTTGALPVFSDAVEITQFTGTVFAYPTNPATTWHLWIKWESVDGVLSTAPAGGTNGQAITTGVDVTKMVQALTGAGKPFTVLNVPTTIGGVTFPAGIYSTNAFIIDLQVTNAKLANLAVDNAKIANVSAAKLTAGAIAVGQYIQSTSFVSGSSGWRINGDGTAEFSNAVVRGTAYIGDGSVGGIIIDGLGIRSANYSGTGTGFRIRNDGTIHLPDGAITVGRSGNLLTNSALLSTRGWTSDLAGMPFSEAVFEKDYPSNDWAPLGGHSLCIYQPNLYYNGQEVVNQWYSDVVPIDPGKRYEFSMGSAAHRCKCRALVVFYYGDGTYASGEVISEYNNASHGGGRGLNGWKRLFAFVTPPAGAAGVRLFFQKFPTFPDGSTNSYAWFTQPYLGVASSSQAVPTDYSVAGVATTIGPDGIITPSLSALSANLGYISAGRMDITSDGAGGVGYVRSAGKSYGDGANGWIMARGADGNSYVELKVGAGRLRFGSWGDYGIDMPGISMSSGGLTIGQVDVINTLNIAGNAVTVPTSATASSLVQPATPTAVLTCPAIDPQGGSVILMASVMNVAGGEEGATGARNTFFLRRNGTVIFTFYGDQTPNGSFTTCVAPDSFNGSAVYDLAMTAGSSGGAYGNATIRTLVVLGTKR